MKAIKNLMLFICAFACVLGTYWLGGGEFARGHELGFIIFDGILIGVCVVMAVNLFFEV